MKEEKRSGKRSNIIIAVLISILLWFYVLNVENPAGTTTLQGIPVELYGESLMDERELLVTDISRDNLTLTATGRRKTFLDIYRSELSVMVDISGVTEPGEYQIVGRVYQDGSLRQDTETRISEQENFIIGVTIKRNAEKYVPVSGEFLGTLAEGYEADPIQIPFHQVFISGPEDVLDRIVEAKVYLNGTSVRESMEEAAEIGFFLPDAHL